MSSTKKSKVNLPSGWIVVNSTSFPDRVYYFNVRTGKSSWTEPSHETNKPKNAGQKRKLSTDTDVTSPDSTSLDKLQNSSDNDKPRRLLRAKRCSETSQISETPQMKALREKMTKQKSKSNQKKKPKQGLSVPENSTQDVTLLNRLGSEELPLCSQRAKQYSESRVVETPQMKALRQKILEKTSKSVQTRKAKSNVSGLENNNEDLPLFVDKRNSSIKLKTQRCCTKLSNTDTRKPDDNVSNVRSTLNAAESFVSKSTTSATSRRTEKLKVEGHRRGLKVDKKKNLANKRLDSLKNKLSTIRKRIEPAISAKVARRLATQDATSSKLDTIFDKSVENNTVYEMRPISPTDPLPSIYQNTESRFRSLRARLASRSSSSDIKTQQENDQSDKAAPSNLSNIPKVGRKKKKTSHLEKTSIDSSVDERADVFLNHAVAQHADEAAFFEEMEWEPIEQEKLIIEVQEVRMHLSTDVGATEQKPPNCTVNGLEFSHVSENRNQTVVYIVVDTNVFLSNLKTVTEILEGCHQTKFQYKPVVVVPWMVLQELDYIKDNKLQRKSTHLQRSAKIAVDLLFQYFSSNHPRLQGQTAADAASNKTKYHTDSPDDEILQTCLKIREFGCTVVLLSNDKNLCNKAMIHHIPTYGRHKSIQAMLLLNANEIEAKSPMTQLKQVKGVENHTETVNSKEADTSDEIFCEAKAIMKNFLSVIVSKEMEKLFGEKWARHVIIQPPWSVMDVLKCTSKHWIAAISDVFVRRAESMVTKLTEIFLNSPKYGQSLKSIRTVLEVCYDLVQMVKSDKYQELSYQSCSNIKKLIDRCDEEVKENEVEKNQTLIELENESVNNEQRANNAFRLFDQIWTFTNNFCGMSADLVGIPHCITYEGFNPAPSAETINRLQPELVSSLNQLIHVLRTVLSEVGCLTVSHPALIALHQSLVNYLPNSGEFNDSSSLDIGDLLCCIRLKKEFLKTGLIQLQELSCQFCRIADFRSMTVGISS
ncbi:transcriptional protein SWT1 isoform X2 [Neodiprion fabricii]|uniref:transcriptional protein SWT1 isoform X2 n=1 Tax=Neodiprion fabricii TaxID=2872261 RepID=UPI001ED96FC3|nr:transcriptional protein SWT1 isoform X2 [Neodiprion fabricii]